MYKFISLILLALVNTTFVWAMEESAIGTSDRVAVAKKLIHQAQRKFDKAYACLTRGDLKESNEARYTLGKIYYNQFWGKYDRTKAKECFEIAAAHGHAGAQYRLACLYDDDARLYWKHNTEGHRHTRPYYPTNGHVNYICYGFWARAEAYYNLAAQQKYSKAYCPLASLYSFGCGVAMAPDLARKYLQLVFCNFPAQGSDKSCPELKSNRPDLPTSYQRARHLLGQAQSKFTEAIASLEEAVKFEDGKAMIALAKIYSRKLWGLDEIDTAYKLLTLARAQGLVDASVYLGLLFQKQATAITSIESVSEHQREVNITLTLTPRQWFIHQYLLNIAADYFREGVKQGNPRAQYALGDAYLEGKGVRQDLTESIRLLKLSAGQGHLEATLTLAYAYEQESPFQNYKFAAELRQSVPLEKHLPNDIIYFADQYREGNGIEQDYRRAAELYDYSSTYGIACSCLSEMYKAGHGVALDLAKCKQYKRKT